MKLQASFGGLCLVCGTEAIQMRIFAIWWLNHLYLFVMHHFTKIEYRYMYISIFIYVLYIVCFYRAMYVFLRVLRVFLSIAVCRDGDGYILYFVLMELLRWKNSDNYILNSVPHYIVDVRFYAIFICHKLHSFCCIDCMFLLVCNLFAFCWWFLSLVMFWVLCRILSS